MTILEITAGVFLGMVLYRMVFSIITGLMVYRYDKKYSKLVDGLKKVASSNKSPRDLGGYM